MTTKTKPEAKTIPAPEVAAKKAVPSEVTKPAPKVDVRVNSARAIVGIICKNPNATTEQVAAKLIETVGLQVGELHVKTISSFARIVLGVLAEQGKFEMPPKAAKPAAKKTAKADGLAWD